MAYERKSLNFLDLPEIVKEKVLNYLSFEELAHLRIVCRRFNQINMQLLNKGFRQVERFHAKCLREVKSQLPRRESERRNHPLFRHCDILTAIETRLSLLNMTFIKYVDCHMCCFIPGKVTDEIFRVLRFIQANKTLPRAAEILTELRDISSMAMEHFEEKIIRSLKPTSLTPASPRFSLAAPFTSSFSSHSSSVGSSATSPSLNKALSLPGASEEISHLVASNKYYKSCVSLLKKEVTDLKSKVTELRRKVSEQEKVALEQSRVLAEQNIKLTNQEAKFNEFNRKMIERDQRLSEMMAEMARLREEQVGSSSSTSGSTSTSRTSGSWRRENSDSQQFFVSHSLPTPAISPAVFVPANIIQPNLVPVNLAAGPLPSTAYLPSSPLAGLAMSMSSGQDSSCTSSHNINSPSGFGSSHCPQGSFPTLQEDVLHKGEDPVPKPSTSYEGGSSGKLHSKKHRKRRLTEEEQLIEDTRTKWPKF